MVYLTEMDATTGYVDAAAVRDKGRELHEAYVAAQPFPHVVIDDFLPAPLLEACLAEFDRSRHDQQVMFDRPQERLKRQYLPDELSPQMRAFFYGFNSRPFLRLIENITGIKGLIPDPYFSGGGFHEIHTGGHLSVHADFNHHVVMNLERRINVLIYLNHGWEDAYGGQLELWENDMSACARSIIPEFNRCVIFNTTSNSNHGNPHPVAHPDGISRKSIALYYYTATWSAEMRGRTTQFRPRRGTEDRKDWQVRIDELYTDLMPPVMRRGIAKVRRGLSARPKAPPGNAA